jgi:hypothetical protein
VSSQQGENKYTIPLSNTMLSYFVDHSIDIPEPACGSYHDFFDRGLLLTRKLLTHGFLVILVGFVLLDL